MAEKPQPTDSRSRGDRLQRVLAARGVASRRKAEELIRAGRVTVNGVVVSELGSRVDPDNAAIRVDGKPVKRQARRYFLLHKPSGFITTRSDERGRQTVMELVPAEPGLFPVGRLDRDTEGLLLMTNDGDIANRVMHPRYGLTKEYLILTPRKPSEAIMSKIREGTEIDGKKVVPHEFRIVRETANGVLLSIVLHEGMNHVVRRLMEAGDIPISHLRRDRIGPLSLAGIPRGSFRELTRGELISLRQALHLDAEEGISLAPADKSARSAGTPTRRDRRPRRPGL